MKVKKLAIITLLLLELTGKQLYAQQQLQKDTQSVHYKLPITVVGKDTIPVYAMDATSLDQEPDAATIAAQQEWDKFLRRVRYVYPYAVACAEKLQDMDATLAQMEKR